ncbi:enolase [Nematocida homosporus]|uniref:enolase n=1 Tax=Nematocida homosporus TaxID=1912981 RepID=UPI00221F1F14|nr:enolase [Nematocida homosporus]KAI5187007.1 enolase [Nematocida homosporus]
MTKVSECIRSIQGRTVFDSRGNPTTEVEMDTDLGNVRDSCPSGASTGSQEALELRDGSGPCGGKGVCRAVQGIEKLATLVLLQDFLITDQGGIDEFMCQTDGTPNKANLGANAILPLSMAFARLGAMKKEAALWQYLNELYGGSGEKKAPKLYFNVINGGAHADNGLCIQEVMVSFGGESVYEVLCNASSFIGVLKKQVCKKYGGSGVGDEGGFAPAIDTLEEALELIRETEKISKITTEIAIDAAASEFYRAGKYQVKQGEKPLSSTELGAYYLEIAQKYKVAMLEDPFAEKDFAGWKAFLPLAQKAGIRVVGDDLLVTSAKLIHWAGQEKLCDVALIKMNQVGTITETIRAVQEARKQGMRIMASHRSGETEDTFLAHLAVGLEADFLKSGSLCRTERICKYNELLRLFESPHKTCPQTNRQQ